MRFFRECFSLTWGLVLSALGLGILLALAVPLSIIVVLLSCILIGVGCVGSLCRRRRKF